MYKFTLTLYLKKSHELIDLCLAYIYVILDNIKMRNNSMLVTDKLLSPHSNLTNSATLQKALHTFIFFAATVVYYKGV